MTIFQFLGTYLVQLWRFFRLSFPATNVSFAALLIFPLFASIVVKFITNILTGLVSTSTTKPNKE